MHFVEKITNESNKMISKNILEVELVTDNYLNKVFLLITLMRKKTFKINLTALKKVKQFIKYPLQD